MLNHCHTRLLTEGARHLGLELSDEHLARFSLYLEEIARWSRATNLISQTDPEVIIRKHILDSLAITPLLPVDARLLDLGSGAASPGLVLAILQPSRQVNLIEARRKRVSFLKETARRIKAVNVQVYEGRAEVLATEDSLRNSFAAVITRATWSLKEFLLLASLFVADGGIAVAMKGPQGKKELSDLGNFLQDVGFYLKKTHDYNLPFGVESRQAIIFAKQRFT